MTSKITKAKRTAALPWIGAAAVLRHPELWLTAIRQAAILIPPKWWRKWPPLPWPDSKYVEFRLSTAYGKSENMPKKEDIVSYLQWCRRQRKLLK